MQMKTQPFRLPMMLTHLHTKSGDQHILHSLDFDLVAVGGTEEIAWKKLVLAVQTYVEFGIGKGWEDSIVFPAPQEFWDKVTPNTPSQIRPSIMVAGLERKVIEVNDEPRRAAA